MEGKLYKSPNGEHYYLTVNGQIFAEIDGHPLKSINQALSLKNCEAIENGYDLDELADEIYFDGCDNTNRSAEIYRRIFKEGFQKALEILGDKKFSEEDMRKALSAGLSIGYGRQFEIENKQIEIDKHIQSLQQTEWDVEIVMDRVSADRAPNGWDEFPKLDEDGCLILRRI